MDTSPFLPAKNEAPVVESASDDWRSKFLPDKRKKIVDKLMENFRLLPVAVPENMDELKKTAVELEEKIYCAAVSELDYLRKIASKMIISEAKVHPAAPISPWTDNQQSSVTDTMLLPQVDNQVQLLPLNPVREQALPQNILYNTSASMQNICGILPSMGIPCCAYLNGLCKTANPANISHSLVDNSAVQLPAQKQYANVQETMERMEQGPFPLLQQTKNRLCHQTHVHPQLVKQKMHNSGMQPSKLQQSSWQHVQSVVIPPNTQPSMNQQTSPQQQSDAIYKQSNLQMQQIQQIMGKQESVPNMSWVQPQMPEQKESVLDAKQQKQQRVPIQHKILLGKHQSKRSRGQKTLYLLPQQQSVLLNNMQDQQQQQQIHKLSASLLNFPNMLIDKQAMHILEQSKYIEPSEELLLQSSMKYLQEQLKQSPHQSLQSPGSEIPFQLGQLQQSLTLQENQNYKQKHMQQSLQHSDSMLRVQSSIEKQKKCIQSHGRCSEAPTTFIEPMDQTGNIGVHWQEEFYQKVQAMKEAYLPELHKFHQMVTRELQQLDAVMRTVHYCHLMMIKETLERQISFLHISKNNISAAMRDKLPEYEKSMFQMLASLKPSQQLEQEQSQQPGGHAYDIPQKMPSQTLLVQQHGNHGKEMRTFPCSINFDQSESVHPAGNLDSFTVGSFSSPQQNSIDAVQKYCIGHFQNSNLKTQHTYFDNLPHSSKEAMAMLPNFSSLENFNVKKQKHMKQEMWKDMLQNQQNECQLQHDQIQQNLLQPQQMQQRQAAKLPVYAVPHPPSLNELTDPNCYHQQLKCCASFPISSSHILRDSSTKISLHSSSQMHQLALLSSLRIPTTPTQCKSSPSAFLSPSTPVATSTVPGDYENKLLPDTGVTERQTASTLTSYTGAATGLQTARAPTKDQSLTVAIPGISGSPLLAQFTSPDGNQRNVQTTTQISPHGQRLKQLTESGNHPLLDEISEVSRSLCDTMVSISDEDSDTAASASEGVKGTVVKCSYSGVSLSPSLRAHFASMNMSPIEPLKLLIPANYPKSSPLVLDKLQDQTRTQGEEVEDLTAKAKSRFCRSLRDLAQLMSLGEMVRLWDACTREIIVEYAQQRGGCTFSTAYCNWQKCVDC